MNRILRTVFLASLLFIAVYIGYNNIYIPVQNGEHPTNPFADLIEQQEIIAGKKDKMQISKYKKEEIEKTLGNYNTVQVDVKINKPVKLSYLSKKRIYEIRKKYFGESIFKYPAYVPSSEVFGQIEDKKPWIDVSLCNYGKSSSVDGLSEESRFINNPSIPVMIDNFYWETHGQHYFFCDRLILPYKATYFTKEKRLDVYYDGLVSYPNSEVPYLLKGLNAVDLGYHYGYIDMNKSSNASMFKNGSNITNQIIRFADFLHTGPSCGVQGGCNNGSPFQPYLEFVYKEKQDAANTHVFYIKLWREQPQSVFEKPDFTERIIISPDRQNPALRK